MTWTPPLTFEEKLKKLIIPTKLYVKYLFKKEIMTGEPEIHLVPFLSSKGKISIDVGANKGVYTFAMLEHSSRVEAFEPNPKPFDVLRRWAGSRVRAHQGAASDSTGEAELLVPGRGKRYSNQGASLSSVKVSGEHRKIRVPTVKLDDMNYRDVGFIKIDVEGHEKQVLAGSRTLLKEEKPNLLVEMEERHTNIPLEAMVQEVCDYGYYCFALVRGTLTPFQRIDLEAHHRNPRDRSDYVFNFIFIPYSHAFAS